MKVLITLLLGAALAGCAGNYRPEHFETESQVERVWVGMSKQAVVKAWGRPDQVNYMQTSEGAREQWVYGAAGDQRFLYFEDEQLVQIDY